jgi:hypothetical protein
VADKLTVTRSIPLSGRLRSVRALRPRSCFGGDAAGFFLDETAVGAALPIVQLNDDALVRALDDHGLRPRDF